MRYSNVTAPFFPQPTLLAEATITCRLVIPLLNVVFRQSVPAQILLFITFGLKHHSKINTVFFLAEWPFKLVHAPSLSSTNRTTALGGNLFPL